MDKFIVSIDQGTTNTKALLIDQAACIVAASEVVETTPIHPHPGWVVYRPDDLLKSVSRSVRSLLEVSGVALNDVVSIGFANQGETVIAFDSESGDPVYPAISWQDRRNALLAEELQGSNGGEITHTTGLFANPYFSALKMRWILDNVPQAQKLLADGRLCLATSDTWLLNRMVTDHPIVTDVSTASRTLLFDIESLYWDKRMLELFGIPESCLAQVKRNDESIGLLDLEACDLHAPVTAMCVDQQAALFGEACTVSGEAKITYGTGCFLLTNIGDVSATRARGILTSVGWAIGDTVTYVLDGGIYNAGSVMKWLVDDLHLAESYAAMDLAIGDIEDSDGVYFIPALHGLAAPHWRPGVTGSWHGLTGASRPVHLMRSAVESIAFRVREIVELVEAAGTCLTALNADGGPTSSPVFMQIQADIIGKEIEVFEGIEATAYGVGLMSGIAAGMWSQETIPQRFVPKRRYVPIRERRLGYEKHYRNWMQLMKRSISEKKREY